MADFQIIPDPSTFRALPWSPTTGWVLCDPYFPDGRVTPFGTRHQLVRALDALAARGFGFLAGLEVEFHVFKLTAQHMSGADAGQPGTPPDVELLSTAISCSPNSATTR